MGNGGDQSKALKGTQTHNMKDELFADRGGMLHRTEGGNLMSEQLAREQP